MQIQLITVLNKYTKENHVVSQPQIPLSLEINHSLLQFPASTTEMLGKPHQIGNSNSAQILFQRLPKPFIHGDGATSSFRIFSLPAERHKTSSRRRIFTSPRTIKAVASTPSTHHEESSSTDEVQGITVKAVVTVQPTVTGFFKNLGIDRGLDDIQDLLGKSLLLEFVSAELDPSK